MYAVQARFSRDQDELQRRKARALGTGGEGAAANLNVILEVEDRPGAAFEIPVASSEAKSGRCGRKNHASFGSSTPGWLAFSTANSVS